MFKKSTSLLAFVLLAFTSIGQTIVSTTPENKKVVLEEFTGIHCVFCPDGHAIAQSIKDADPENVFLVNIHVGSYANPGSGEPDFRTPYGTAIVNQTGLVGYPGGTVNRMNFPGYEQGTAGTTAMSRNRWAAASNQTKNQASYVNIGVEATIDVQTSELIVHMEGYYTGDSPEGTNLLNIALLQNNTLGPQTGGNSGNEYNHQHRLVEMLTGQWGMDILTTTTGTLVDETITYTIPADYNGVPVVLADLEVVAFITETHQAIASGNGAKPTYTGITIANDAALTDIDDISDDCNSAFADVAPTVAVENLGADTITALTIEYSVNGGDVHTYEWTGSIPTYHEVTIELPEINYPVQAENELSVTIPDDENNTNNVIATDFRALNATTTVHMELHTDGYGSEVSWNVKDYSGATVYNGGPYGNNQTINETFELASDCYTFNIIDSYGDGGGSVELTDDNSLQVFYTDGTYGSGDSQNFSTDGFLGTNTAELEGVNIYPNPATTILNIVNAENSSIEVYNMLGQVLYTKSNISLNEQVTVSQLTAGTYFVKITNGNAVKTTKFIKN